MQFVVKGMNVPVRDFKEAAPLTKFCELMGETGFVLPNALMLLMKDTPSCLLHFVVNDKVMQIGYPLVYLGLAHVDCVKPKPTILVPASILHFMHAFVESLKCEKFNLKSPFECLFPSNVPKHHELADLSAKEFKQYCLRWMTL
jgi:hypothetical protein